MNFRTDQDDDTEELDTASATSPETEMCEVCLLALPSAVVALNLCMLLSAMGRLLLPALDFGTVYLLTSGLPRHSQHFVKS